MQNRIISTDVTILNALDAINRLSGTGVMTLLAVDADGRLQGTLTDGDIRRALLNGASTSDPVSRAMNRGFHALHLLADGTVDVQTLAQYRALGHRLLPVLDADEHLVRLIDTTLVRTQLPLRAVVMAGGRGERLRPLTLTTPKPLLEVGGRAIIDHNIAMLAAAGITDITVTTHYLAEQLEAHFADDVCGVKVRCVREVTPMGTAGALSLCGIPDDDGYTLVMNSDLLTDISLEQMWLKHHDTKAAITVATVPYTVNIPFAILSAEEERVTALVEKPSYTWQANAGIYIISNHIIAAIDPMAHTDATDLIESTITAGHQVSRYPIEGTWIDIGSPNDYRRACQMMAFANN